MPAQGDAMQPLEHATTLETKSMEPPVPDPTVRKLKIEADGDPWKGLTKPKIRLTGRWLERAGFSAGNRVHVTCLAPGVIELRSSDDGTMNDKEKHSPAQPDCPF